MEEPGDTLQQVMAAHEQAMRLLQPMPRLVAEAAGLPAAVAFVQRWGGLPLWVPRQATADHEIAQVATLEGMRALIEPYGGTTVVVPKCTRALAAARATAIRIERERSTIKELATRHRMHMRWVKHLVSPACGQLLASNESQRGLFEP